jgi:hypothetical protein
VRQARRGGHRAHHLEGRHRGEEGRLARRCSLTMALSRWPATTWVAPTAARGRQSPVFWLSAGGGMAGQGGNGKSMEAMVTAPSSSSDNDHRRR